MDYYVWFARVMFSLRASRLVPWKALHDQFGSQYDWQDRRSRFDFRSESIKADYETSTPCLSNTSSELSPGQRRHHAPPFTNARPPRPLEKDHAPAPKLEKGSAPLIAEWADQAEPAHSSITHSRREYPQRPFDHPRRSTITPVDPGEICALLPDTDCVLLPDIDSQGCVLLSDIHSHSAYIYPTPT